jgi:rhodanese-related sulfurtransferase
MEGTLEITPQELQARVAAGDAIALIDVREPEEHSVARIEGAELIPMQSVPAQLQKLEGLADEKDLAVFCHHGVRSLNVVLWLRQHGLENCFSITGGIDRWSCEIDPSVPRY